MIQSLMMYLLISNQVHFFFILLIQVLVLSLEDLFVKYLLFLVSRISSQSSMVLQMELLMPV